MAEFNESKLIRDLLGNPIPQHYNVEKGIFIANTNGTGDATNVDFSKIKMLRDLLGSPIPQYYDVGQGKFVPSTSEGGGEVGPQGPPGEKGDPGPPGSDANVTSANIANALGYTPANNTDLTTLDNKVTTHLDKKATNTELGHIKTSNHFDLDHNGIPKNNKFNANTLILSNVAPSSDLANLPDSCRYYAFIDGVGFVEGLKEVSGGYTHSWQQRTDIKSSNVYRRYALSATQWSDWRHVSFYDVVTSDYTTGQIIGSSVPLIDGNAYLLSIRISRHASSSDVFLYTGDVQGASRTVIPIGNGSSDISIVIDENNIIYVTNTSGNNLVLQLGVMPLT